MPYTLDAGRNVFTRGIRSIGTTSVLLSAVSHMRVYICVCVSIERANWIRTGSAAIVLHRLKPPLLPLRIGGTEEYRREKEREREEVV